MEWQPIETAPKDGTEFQVWICSKHSSYWSPYAHFEDGKLYVDDGYGGDVMEEDATHWMPPPEPPK